MSSQEDIDMQFAKLNIWRHTLQVYLQQLGMFGVKSQALLPPTIIKLAGYCTPFSLVTGLVSCSFVGEIDVASWLVIVASFAR